jgi:hypothetical protein
MSITKNTSNHNVVRPSEQLSSAHLPPSIIEKKILVDIPDDYGCYLYRFIDTLHLLQACYIGIKKDKLPEHGGEVYWSSSKNEEFIKLVQGDEKRFILEILDFRKKEDYDYLQLKEYTMLKEYSKIKTNKAIYNLSYGIPPVSQNSLLDERFLKWYHFTKDSGIWHSKKDESVLTLHNMNTVQIRDKDSDAFVQELTAEIKKNGGNTSNMNPVLIFEGVGELFGFAKGSDVVVGTRHGLRAAKRAKSLGMKTIRVPYEVLKDKTQHFLRALASNDNYDSSELKYVPPMQDGAKFLVDLYNAEGFEPRSDIAKQQLDITYGFKTKKKADAISRAETAIKMQMNGNTKWKYYSKKELEDIEKTNTTDDTLVMTMTAAFFDNRKIFKKLQEDEKLGKCRKKLICWFYFPDDKDETQWPIKYNERKEFIDFISGGRFNIKLKTLPSIILDTENDYSELDKG